MYHLIIGLIVLVCILLILIVLVQNSKGGGLASNFSSSNQVMGVRQTTDFLEKATWYLAIALLVLTVSASIVIPRDDENHGKSKMNEQILNAPDPSAIPNLPKEENKDNKSSGAIKVDNKKSGSGAIKLENKKTESDTKK
ncbi:MAG: preprotein translocase subunit SecG [Bacteroidetes bacterium 4572_128]|nr:MAG: preprotein translocase subunit SecG [Bacteroidetes bacterium 4572_128]